MTRRHTLANRAAEEAIIGALMGVRKDAFSVVEEHLRFTDFWDPHHGAAFQALGDLWSRGLTPTVPSVVGSAADKSSVELDPEKLEKLASKVKSHLTNTDMVELCRTVSDFASRRRLKAACEASIAATVVDGKSPLEIIDELQRKLLDGCAPGAYEPQDARDVAAEVFAEAEAMSKTNGFPGIRTGFQQLDKAILGFRPGKVIVLAGRPGMGKSSLLKDFAMAVARDDQGCAIFNLEMTNRETIARQISGMAKVSYRSIITGQMKKDEWSRLAGAVERFRQGNLLMDDNPSGMAEIRRRARGMKSRLERAGRKLNVIGIDYLQLINGTKERREESIADISRGMKMMAKELDCTVVALAQLNRELERREDKRPVMSDLRDSGAIEQDADTILFVFRQHIYDQSYPETQAELIVSKNRDGATGTIPLDWIPSTMSFSDAKLLDVP